ncbi:hypothetical protein [Dokdonia sp.]|uniref:hypothetical protein n=1 Tax=Dokdonia sp. TaxID=2024995 RepID=UPI00326400DB
MQRNILQIAFLFFIGVSYAQVGIGTTTPSDASMLDISPTPDGGTTFRGLMPPVMTVAQRNLIPVTATDVGLLVFINDSVEGVQCLQFYTGTTWECANNASATGFTVLAAQDFDTTTSWNFTLTPTAYNDPITIDVWDVVNTLDDITGFTGNFLGCQDLDNPTASGDHTIAFDNIDVSTATAPKVSFDYDIFEYDTGDSVFYELFYDDVSQGTFPILTGIVGGISLSGTTTLNIPNTVTNVRISIIINQNGNTDTAGFDNFRVFE